MSILTQRELIAHEIEAMVSPESGPDYGMMSDEERNGVRAHNRTILAIATNVRSRKD